MKRLGLLVAVLGLAACGGSSGLTKAQYDARVNRLCLVSADRFRELHLDNTIGDYRHYASSIVHIDEAFAKQLARWKPPASIASAATAFAKANEKVARDDTKAIAAARAGDSAKLQAAIKQANTDGLATSAPARAIGATGCYIP
jgi:formate dehydrogenase maturation protein FdhE